MCQGFGVFAPKAIYEKWQQILEMRWERAIRRHQEHKEAIPFIEVEIAKFKKGRRPCSFCNGYGNVAVKKD